MKIFYINNFFTEYGGAEIIMLNEAKIFKQNGHEVCFFATNKQPYFIDNIEGTEFFPQHTDFDNLSLLQGIKNIPKTFYNFEAKKNLNLYLKKYKPDIVHLHNIYFHLTPSVLSACFKNKIPTMMTLHDPKLMCPAGTLMLKNKNYCKNHLCIGKNPFNCILNKCKKSDIKASTIAVAECLFRNVHRLYDRVDVFITPSQALYNLALKSGIKKEKLAVVENFIEDKYFETQPEYDNQGYFLYVGRLAKEKGVNYLLEAMKVLPPDIKLHLAGTGPEENELKSLAKGMDNIKFLGHISGVELENQYKKCIAAVMPCDWFEIFGLTIVEAFAFGKPVIASNIGAIPEIVEHNINGLLVEPGNINQLTESIEHLHHNPKKVIELGRNARQKAEEKYTSCLHYNKLMKLMNH